MGGGICVFVSRGVCGGGRGGLAGLCVMGMEVVVFFFSFLWSTQEKSRDIFLGEEEDAFGDITLLVLAQICKIWALQIVSMAASIITEEFNLRELQKELAAIEV